MGDSIQRADVGGIDEQQRVAQQAESVADFELDGFELPPDFQMPTTEEIEQDLALGEPGWMRLLKASEGESARTDSQTSACLRWPKLEAFVFVAAVPRGARTDDA